MTRDEQRRKTGRSPSEGRKAGAKVRREPTRRSAKKPAVLDGLKPEEAQELLRRLLAAHPALRAEAEQIAQSILAKVSFEAVADEVEEAVRALDLDDLRGRSGRHAWGYVEPTEAAWEVLGEAVEPFIEDMKRHIGLGLEAEALELCKGVLLGLYRVRDEKTDDGPRTSRRRPRVRPWRPITRARAGAEEPARRVRDAGPSFHGSSWRSSCLTGRLG